MGSVGIHLCIPIDMYPVDQTQYALTTPSCCSVLPRILLFSILGYPYSLPDMVGGNGYGIGGQLLAKELPTAELYIRWIQTNVILPMQLSISPWRFKGDPPRGYAIIYTLETPNQYFLP